MGNSKYEDKQFNLNRMKSLKSQFYIVFIKNSRYQFYLKTYCEIKF